MATFKNKDQAEHLRTEAQKAESFDFGTSSLPSRKEVHGKKKQKIKWRIKYPLLKILTFFFILLIISTFAMYSYLTKNDSAGETRESSSVAEGESASGAGDEIVIDLIDEEEESEPADTNDKENAEAKEEAAENKKEETKAENGQKPTASAPAVSKPAAGSTSEQGSNAGTEEKSDQDETAESGNTDGYRVVEHVVKAQETIFRISMNYYNSQEGIELIKEWNGLTSNNVRVGQVLKIPLKE